MIKAEKREGPSTEPWRIPEVGKTRDEKELLTRVIWQWSERYDSNQATADGRETKLGHFRQEKVMVYSVKGF